jgi:serine/threonine protein kinase
MTLTALRGSLAGQTFIVPPLGLHIGRSPDNHLVLAEPMVSRNHAELVLRQEGCLLCDRNSINGTYVDGIRIYERMLQPGNRIQIGLSEFVYHPAGTAIPPTPSEAAAVHSGQYTADRTPRFEDYRIEGLIGGGGMAEVYRARAANGRLVAIKIPKVANDPYLLRKFETEGNRIGALLQGHPYIVHIEHFGYTQDGTPYIVMEYVDGGSLRARARQPLTNEDIKRIVGQTCLALAHAHRFQIVHRDIKPENILLTSSGTVKVADFGIAKQLSGITVTHKGPVGTPEYMAPEQASGEDIQPGSDVYAAGIVLYELMTGRVPFPRRVEIQDDLQQALDVVERHLHEIPRPPHELKPSVPPELERVALKALAKQPRERYRDGGEMGRALGFKPVSIERPAKKPPARLVIIQGMRRGQCLVMTSDLLEITRQQLDPESTAISRRHAVIRRRGDDFWIEDCSMNGTWVNGQRISGDHLLSVGDQIRIGNCVLRIEV